MSQTSPPENAPATSWPPGGKTAADPFTRWLASLTRGVNTATVVRSAVEALVVVLGSLILLSILLAPVLASVDGVDLGAGAAVRTAAVLLGLAAFGRLGLQADLDADVFQVSGSGSLGVAPLTVTALLVVGFALAARARPHAGFRHHVQASALTGIAAGIVLAVVAMVATTSNLPALDALGELAEARLQLGVGPFRVLLAGGVLAALSGFLPRMLTHVRAGWGGARALPWLSPASTALRFALVAGVLAALLVVVALAVQTGGSGSLPSELEDTGDLALWATVLALLPNIAGVVVGLATGTSVVAGTTISGEGADLLDLDRSDALQGSYGLWSQLGEGRLWLALAVALLVLLAVSVRTALLHDPRSAVPGAWWRTGAVFAVLAAVAVLVSGGSGSLMAEASSPFGSGTDGTEALGGLSARGGLSLLGALPMAFGLGALSAVLQQRAARGIAGTVPWLVGLAHRLPGGVHPLWSLLLVDASSRLGREAPARLVEQAHRAAPEAAGLAPLSVDRSRSRVVVAGLAIVGVLVVVVPAGLAVLSATVYGPEAAARQYADALRTGDAGALREAAGGLEGPALTDAALQAQRSAGAITDVEASVDGSGEDASASVTFRVAGKKHVQQVSLDQSSDRVWGLLPRWEATASLPEVYVTAPTAAKTVMVNGQELGAKALAAAQGAVSVFPGMVTVVPTLGEALTTAPWKGVASSDSSDTDASFTVDLAPAAQEQAEKALTTWLAKCEASTKLEPSGCPLSIDYASGDDQSDVSWVYDAPTDVTVIADPETGHVIASGAIEGTASYDYAYDPDYFTLEGGSTEDDDYGFFSGTVRYSGKKATFVPDRSTVN